MTMSGMLQGKVIIVTGGGSGIGAAAATRFAAEDASVIVADLRPEQGAAVTRQIEATGGRVRFHAVDVSQEAQVASLVSAVVKEFGRLDGAFNNAGIGPKPALLADATEEDWQ